MRNYTYNPKTNGEITTRKYILLLNQVVTVLLTACLVFCALVYITNRTFYTAEVVGASMYPTINSTAKKTNVNDIAYYTLIRNAKKGDIIIVDYENAGENIDAIKRLIAVGGDTICYHDGNILLNGQILKEPYMENNYNNLKNNPDLLVNSGFVSADDWKDRGFNTSKQRFESWCETLLDDSLTEEEKDARLRDTTFFKNYSTDYADSVKYSEVLDTYILTVPQGFVFFLGDNRENSTDCSVFGPLEQKDVLAKVDFVAVGNSTIYSILSKKITHLFA